MTATPVHDDLVGQLVALARNAHTDADLQDPADFWYRLGQRNAYAHAAALSAPATDRDHLTIGDQITTALSSGVSDLTELARLALDDRPGVTPIDRSPAGLEWVGPVAFAAAYGSTGGVDHDYGMRWGQRRDVRITLRKEPGAPTGMLYAYDATWDEYAVLHPAVATAVVDAAFAQAHHDDPGMPVEQFLALVHDLDRARVAAAPMREAGIGVTR